MNASTPIEPNGPRVLAVLAHPDDECIFGWPVFQNPRLTKSLIMLVSDRDNPERQWCARRLDALEEIGAECGFQTTCLHLDSEFYRLPYRRADLIVNDVYRLTLEAIDEHLRSFAPHFVFCHNPYGEYGMFDHRIVFDIVYHHSAAANICITDLCEAHRGWPSADAIPQRIFQRYYADNPCLEIELNSDFYCWCKNVYERYGCWTWHQKLPPEDPPATCRLFLLADSADRPETLQRFATLGS